MAMHVTRDKHQEVSQETLHGISVHSPLPSLYD